MPLSLSSTQPMTKTRIIVISGVMLLALATGIFFGSGGYAAWARDNPEVEDYVYPIFGDSNGGGGQQERIVYVERPKPPLELYYDWRPGTLFVHDLDVTNTCGEELNEVNVTFTFVGDNGTESVKRYWAQWPLGWKKNITMDINKVRNVQRIKIQGTCNEGVISAELQPN